MAEFVGKAAEVESVETVSAPGFAPTEAAELAWSEDVPALLASESRRPLPRALRWLLVAVAVGAVGVGGAAVGRQTNAALPAVTITVTPSPIVPAPTPTPTTKAMTAAEADDTFLSVAKHAGLIIVDPAVAIASARNSCNFLRQGHSAEELYNASREQNPSWNPKQATGYVDAVIIAYCPELAYRGYG